MTGLSDVMKDIRGRQRVKPHLPTEIVGFWTGEDLLDGKPVKTNTIIFRTKGCYWGHRAAVPCAAMSTMRRRYLRPMMI